MEIKVVTRSKDKRELIHAVAIVFADILNIKNSTYTLVIGTTPGLTKALKMNGAICQLGPKSLLIWIDSRLSMDQLFITLAHEMVHVKQYAKGQLKVKTNRLGKPTFTWLGKKYSGNYCTLPWEIEAFSRERVLANQVACIVHG